MKIIVGLGNPGPKYETTRHNVGFLAVDRLVDHYRASPTRTKVEAEVYSADLAGEKLLLVKPLTFMNLSGRAVAPLFKFYQCAPTDLIVVHDDLDIEFPKLRMKAGGSAGGHNGLKSIDSSLGAELQGYFRVRIGIGKPKAILQSGSGETAPRKSTIDWVLEPFSQSELKALDLVFDQVSKACDQLLQGQLSKAQNEFH